MPKESTSRGNSFLKAFYDEAVGFRLSTSLCLISYKNSKPKKIYEDAKIWKLLDLYLRAKRNGIKKISFDNAFQLLVEDSDFYRILNTKIESLTRHDIIENPPENIPQFANEKSNEYEKYIDALNSKTTPLPKNKISFSRYEEKNRKKKEENKDDKDQSFLSKKEESERNEIQRKKKWFYENIDKKELKVAMDIVAKKFKFLKRDLQTTLFKLFPEYKNEIKAELKNLKYQRPKLTEI